MDLRQWFTARQSRRSMLQNLGILAGLGLTYEAGVFATRETRAAIVGSDINPVNHVLIACQENRTFDDYFGYYPKAGKFGLPANYALPDGKGGTVTPYHNFLPISNNPSHSWQSIHSEWNKGAMDGFYTADGSTALGYYAGSDLPYDPVGRVVGEERVAVVGTVRRRHRRLWMNAVERFAGLAPDVPCRLRVASPAHLLVEREDAALPVEQVEGVMAGEPVFRPCCRVSEC